LRRFNGRKAMEAASTLVGARQPELMNELQTKMTCWQI
jgi:hypothetical protein